MRRFLEQMLRLHGQRVILRLDGLMSMELQDFTQGDGTSGTTSTTSVDISGLTPGSVYDIYIQANCTGEDSTWVMVTFTMPIAGDNIVTAVPITPSAAGTGCDTVGFTLNFSSDGTTDSGLDGSCNNSNTGLDQFFTWTATTDALFV